MIEKVIYKKKMLALIVRGKYRSKKGITFFTDKNSTQQFGYMNHKKKYIIKPHLHKKRLTKILYTTEVILILKGILRVDFYNVTKKYLFSKLLKEKDIKPVLDEFDEEFRSSFIRNKLTIDTSNSTVKESLQEFVTNIGPFLSDRDRLRIQANQILKS